MRTENKENIVGREHAVPSQPRANVARWIALASRLRGRLPLSSFFRPVVFLLTDGQPTDDWEDAARNLKTVQPKPANIYAIGCGHEVDFHVLREITDTAYHLKDVSEEMIAKFFIWMSVSVQSMSQGATLPFRLTCRPSPVKGDST